jgi:hypothetical protein
VSEPVPEGYVEPESPLGPQPKTQETMCDEHKAEYFRSGYEAGKKETMEPLYVNAVYRKAVQMAEQHAGTASGLLAHLVERNAGALAPGEDSGVVVHARLSEAWSRLALACAKPPGSRF